MLQQNLEPEIFSQKIYYDQNSNQSQKDGISDINNEDTPR